MAETDHAASVQSSPDAVTPDQLLRLLLDEERLAILGMTAQTPVTIEEMGAALNLKRATLTRHLAQLTAAGLLVRAADERVALNVARIRALKQALFARPAAPKPDSDDAQVIATFVRDGKLTRMPVQHGKRQVILAWLAAQFEAGRGYREPEVNDLLRGHAEDHVTLRRYLVDAGHLERAAGIYRRATPQPESPS